jgi:hypothetical protein
MCHHFYSEITRGIQLPDMEVTDLIYGSPQDCQEMVKARALVLGSNPGIHYSPAQRSAILQSLGLWPDRIQIIVEGESEEIVLTRLLSAYRPAAMDVVQIASLEGVGQAKHKLGTLIKAGNLYTSEVFVVSDDEGPIKKKFRDTSVGPLIAIHT